MTDELSTLTRKPHRGSTDRTRLDALLDDEMVATLSTVTDSGEPWAVPMLFARDGDRILFHGSTGAGALRHLAAGAPVALTVMALDGIVVASSTFDHSANYRSAVVRGVPETLTGDEQARALDVLTDRILPGRSGEVRPSRPKEWSATAMLALPITEGKWLYKERTGGPGASEEEHSAWTGVIPFGRTAGVPEPAADAVGPVPDSVWSLVAAYKAPIPPASH